MKVYIAGRFDTRDKLKEMRQRVRELGYECECEWMDVVVTGSVRQEEEEAEKDVRDVAESGIFILDETLSETGRGKYFEAGLAYAAGCDLVLVGPRRFVFAHLFDEVFETWEECLEWLGD